jgi:tetratricopeptide (TPR) repeat protein
LPARCHWLLIFCLAVASGESLAAETAASDPANDAALRQRIDSLIRQLGDKQFAAREAAQSELAKIGPEAFDALTIAENDPDLEIAARAHYLLGLIEFKWVRDDDPPEIKEALSEYERSDADNRRQKIEKLAQRPSLDQVAALCRIVRFEKSNILSKQAALAIIGRAVDPPNQFDETILAGIGASPRPAATWLRLHALSHTRPEEAAARWGDVVAAEERLLKQTQEQSSPQIVADLLKRHADQLMRLGKQDEALAVMRRVIAQPIDDAQSLVALIDWLADHQARDLLAEVEATFADRFRQEPLALYALAQAWLASGQSEPAQQMADRAFAMNPGDPAAHVEVAGKLHRRGLADWAIREFRHVIELGPPESLNTLNAQFQLADLLHDQLDDLEAAQLLESGLATLQKAAEQGNNNAGVDVRRVLDAIRGHATARFNYYFACHYGARRDRSKELEHLEKAIAADPLDADVLIALYRLPDQTPEQRMKTETRIAAVARHFRNEIAENPRDASAYNQLAWLLSNTDRDQQEALRCSQESLKLRPNEPGLLDTLGRCYYALGDYENAVKYQSKAVEMEPHSGVMRRQLELFQKALHEKRGQASGA